MRLRLGFCIGWLMMLLASLWAQPTGRFGIPAQQTPAQPAVVATQANLALVDGAPLALFWARGLTDKSELAAYAKAGLNALYVTLASDDDAALTQADELMAAGEQYNLASLIGLNVAAVPGEIDPDSSTYRLRVNNYALDVAAKLKGRPSLVGWVVEGLAPDLVVESDAGFQRWLQNSYRDLQSLNQVWGTNFTSFGQITRESPLLVNASYPGMIGRAMLDLGFYRYWSYRDLLDLWAGALRRADGDHLVILGGQPSVRESVTLPESFSGIVTQAYGTTASPYGGFSGIEAIDIARRANSALAFGFADANNLTAGSLYGWAGQALIHGAAGLGFDGWSKIRTDQGLQQTLLLLNQLAVEQGAFPQTPRSQFAFLYEPLGGGPGYGYLPQQPAQTPGALFAEFGRGTRYGGADYLTEEMLAGVDLSRYSTLFAPQAYAVSDASQRALLNYVNNGGVVVADWGIGAFQSGSLTSLPPMLANLFGTGFIYATPRTPLDIIVFSIDPLFPSMPFQAVTSGRRAGGAFFGLLGDVKITGQNTKRFMTLYNFGTYVPSVLLTPVGQGAALFASASLWENWQRGDNLFEPFHSDLISRQARVAVLGNGSLFTNEDLVLYNNGALGLFRTSASDFPTQVQLASGNSDLYRIPGGYQLIGAERPTFGFGLPGANIALPVPLQLRATSQVLVKVKDYRPASIALELHGFGATLNQVASGVALSGGENFTGTLTITNSSNGYSFAPNSRHQVVVRDPVTKEQISRQELSATDRNTLEMPVSGTAVELIITPAAAAKASR